MKKWEQTETFKKRFIDVVCFLGEQQLAFRGHDESQKSANRGNYVELLNLCAKTDPLLKSHLEKSSVFSGLSNRIKNDLINSVGEILLNKVKNEINNASFVALILDETTDVTTVSQLSSGVRYATQDCEICEIFLRFTNVNTDRTAVGLTKLVFNLVDELNFGSKFIAQAYDGASVMSSELKKLKRKLGKSIQKLFLFIVWPIDWI